MIFLLNFELHKQTFCFVSFHAVIGSWFKLTFILLFLLKEPQFSLSSSKLALLHAQWASFSSIFVFPPVFRVILARVFFSALFLTINLTLVDYFYPAFSHSQRTTTFELQSNRPRRRRRHRRPCALEEGKIRASLYGLAFFLVTM